MRESLNACVKKKFDINAKYTTCCDQVEMSDDTDEDENSLENGMGGVG